MSRSSWVQAALFTVLGALTGAAGARLFGGDSRAHVVSAPHVTVAPRAAQLPVRKPPGWDDWAASAVKSAAAADTAKVAVQPAGEAGTGGQATQADFERERRAHYQEELALREQQLSEHAKEPRDGAWSQKVSEEVRNAFSEATRPLVKEVDCRSATCTATLGFPSPDKALAFVAAMPRNVLGTDDCNGYNIIPTPPTGNGAYDLTVFFTCRR